MYVWLLLERYPPRSIDLYVRMSSNSTLAENRNSHSEQAVEQMISNSIQCPQNKEEEKNRNVISSGPPIRPHPTHTIEGD
jgi:hypothetical protein